MSIIQETQQKIQTGSKKYFDWLDLALLLLIAVYILAGIDRVPFHGDESTFIFMSEDYDTIVKQGRFERVLFKPEQTSKQFTRITIGSILPFLIGFARDIADLDPPDSRWLWGASWQDNILKGNLPDARLLRLGRACSALMGALSVAVFFITVRQFSASRLAAWTATLVLASHGDVLVNFRRAMQEGPKFLFLTLTLFIAFHILKDLHRAETRRYLYVLLGITSGLTLAAKQDTAPMLVAIYFALALIPLGQKGADRTLLSNGLFLTAATCLAYICFLALMPVFWGWWESAFVLAGFVIILFQLPRWNIDPAAKLLSLAGCAVIIAMTLFSPSLWRGMPIPVVSMIDARKEITAVQAEFSRGRDRFTLGPQGDKLLFLVESTVTSRIMYAESPTFDVAPFHEQITAYQASPISGRTGSLLGDSLVAILAIAGGWCLSRRFSALSPLIYSSLILSGLILFGSAPHPWQRYFLIMQIPYALLAGLGAHRIWIWGKNAFGPRSVPELEK